jgi:hypothetical protein
VTRPRAADDFATIRARMEELRREREGAQATESNSQRDSPLHCAGRRRSLAQDWGGPANLVQLAARSDLIPEHSTASNKPKSAPALRYPTCSKISVECWIGMAAAATLCRERGQGSVARQDPQARQGAAGGGNHGAGRGADLRRA